MAESDVPLKLRKQMLLMRATVERVELAQQVLDVKQAATLSAIVKNAMPGNRSRSVSSRAFDLLKRYPFVGTAAAFFAKRMKVPILVKATKWGGAATVLYKLWTLWQSHRPVSSRLPPARRLTR